MSAATDPTLIALLNDWQRGFPVVERPFDVVGESLGLSGEDVIAALGKQRQHGRITRVGATCAPNTISASTLAAVSAPENRIEEVAGIIGAEPGVNHSYLREDDWNLWVVATGPDRAHVDGALARISERSRLRVLDLRLVRPFNVDLGFTLVGTHAALNPNVQPDASVLEAGDRSILQMLLNGLPLEARPYRKIGEALGRDEADILRRIAVLVDARIISRLGVIVRHRALGWRANAMVVWDLPSEAITEIGPLLAAQPGITLCYERTPVPDVWPYRLYTMIHAKSRASAFEVLSTVADLPQLRGVPHKPLFSTRCFRQTGAMVEEAA